MKIAKFSLPILFIAFTWHSANAGWSRQCLEDCFSTGHDCNFCAYQCTAEPPPAPPYTGHMSCPLEGYWDEINMP